MQNSDTDTPYTDTIQHFEELYDAETDRDKKFTLLIAQIQYLIKEGDYDEAEKLVLRAYIPDLTDEQQYILADATYKLYIEKEDQTMADFYDNIRSELSQKIESDGGA